MKDLDKIPNSVLKGFQPFLNKETNLYLLEPNEEVYLNFVGKGNVLDCFLQVTNYRNERGKFVLTIRQKPHNVNINNEHSFEVGLESLSTILTRWNSLIQERNELKEFFNNSARLKQLEEEFFSESPYSKSDFDNEYFSIAEAKQLSDVCINLIDYVETAEEIKNKEEIIKEINFLEVNSAQESKRKLAQRFAKIKALMVKNGPKVLKAISEIGVNVAGNVIAKMITG